jgi:tetratricopeptide (TPR) repeat protein
MVGPVCVLLVQAWSAGCWPSAGQGVRGGTAVEEPALTFAGLLRRLRAEARLTQEELAAAAGLSPRSVSDLERGINRTARKDSAVLLAGALGLPGAVAELFVAAARGRGLAGDVASAWLEAERANLHAAADYAASRGRSRHAIVIPAAIGGFLAARGHWDQSAALHHSVLAAARQAGDRAGEADTLCTLGTLQRETGDYPAAAASHQQSLVLVRGLGDRRGQAWTLNGLALVQHLTGDYPAAAAGLRQALALFGDLGDLHGQARALNDLGLVQQETGDYPAAAASHQQALALFGDLGNLLGQAEALNRLGELSLRTSATGQARDQHTRALAIARDISATPEEARALEGLGRAHIQDGNHDKGVECLRQALTIYQHIGAPAAQRVRETLRNPSSPEGTERPDPGVITPTPG